MRAGPSGLTISAADKFILDEMNEYHLMFSDRYAHLYRGDPFWGCPKIKGLLGWTPENGFVVHKRFLFWWDDFEVISYWVRGLDLILAYKQLPELSNTLKYIDSLEEESANYRHEVRAEVLKSLKD